MYKRMRGKSETTKLLKYEIADDITDDKTEGLTDGIAEEIAEEIAENIREHKTENIIEHKTEAITDDIRENMVEVKAEAIAEEVIAKVKNKKRNQKAKSNFKHSKKIKTDSKQSKQKVLSAKLKDKFTYVGEQTLPLRRQMRFKLVMAFLVPALLMIALGTFSYQRSKGTIVNNYEQSSQGNIDNGALSLTLLMDEIETKASQMSGDKDLIFYYSSYDTNSIMDANTYYTNAKTTLTTLIGSSSGIYSAYVFGSVGNPISTLAKSPSSSLYADFTASEEASKWTEAAKETGGMKSMWMGYHPSIDAGAGSIPDQYAATYVRDFTKGEGYIVFDLLKTKVLEVLENSIASDNSIVALVTADGRETIATGEKKTLSEEIEANPVFASNDFYKKAIDSEKESGYSYVTYEGDSNLFVYSKIGDTGAIICTLIPKSDILSRLGSIRIATTLFVIIACAIAILLGLYLSTDIGRMINKFSASFKQISAGDFTLRVKTSRMDEFGVLAQDMDDMLVKMRELVGNMASFGSKVSEAAIKVSGASGEILTSINEVSSTVNEMGQGIYEQVNDTEKCYLEMTSFAGQIGEACEDTEQVGKVADQTQQIINNGKNIVSNLMEQVNSTAEITNIIIKDIDELQEQSKSIGSVIVTINSIASTTNLLSLNASIEAARAGDAGRGFAVVAEEIRHLADQSVDSVKMIEKIIKNIQQKTLTTASAANQAEQMLTTQAAALNNTVMVFQDVDNHVVDLSAKINHIMTNMQTITVSKDEVLDSIKSIASVTEQTAASSEEVGATVTNQIASVETLNSQAEEMKDRARELQEAISKLAI